MSDAFQESWDIAKIDFRLDNTSSRDNTLGWSSAYPSDYEYRVPTGRDKDGNLLYEGKPRSVEDSSWVNLGAFSNPEEEAINSYGETIQDRIINTIIHESMHDADREIGSPARDIGRAKGRPRFGNRFRDAGGPTGRSFNVPVSLIDAKEQGKHGMVEVVDSENEFEGFRLEPNELITNPSPPETGSGLTRDEDLAAETMAYLGEYPLDEKRRNLAIARHPNVSPTDTAFLLDKYGTWNTFYNPRKKMTPKKLKNRLRIGYRPGFPLEHTLSERIRRNLINALDDTAMTRMTQSGEFLENPFTSIVGGFGEGARESSRPLKAQLDAARKETSKARRAINAHWKKIEAGKAPLPNSIDDLPQNIQELIGQQQIRAKLGRMRGLESEAIDRGRPAINMDKKYRSLIDQADSREEKVDIMRNYAKELLSFYKPSEPKTNMWGDYSDYQEWIGDLPVLREMMGGKSNDPNFDWETYDENQPRWIYNYPELREQFPKLAELETLVPRKGGATIGNVYDIVPFDKKPASIPLSDWIEMYNYNLRENKRRQQNE